MIGVGAWLGAAAVQVSQRLEDAEFDLLVRPLDRLLERDPQVVAEVRAGLRAASPRGRRTRAATEERIEDVGEATEAFEPGRARTRPWPIDPGSPEHVVAAAPLRVGQDLVGLVDLLEALLRGSGRC